MDETLHDSLSAIILAGGRSTRMGRPKAWLDFGGEPLLARLVARVRERVREVVVVAAAAQDLPAQGARVVRDRTPDLGPLPALLLGLETLTTPHAFALGCDTPLLRPAVLDLLAREHLRAGALATLPEWDGRLQPLVAVYDRTVAATLATLVADDERRMQAIAAIPGVQIIRATFLRTVDPDGASFRAMNTPAEYADAHRAWAKEQTHA
jgi:molybdopterin-guanine dinucleotide biosynthesis protein A